MADLMSAPIRTAEGMSDEEIVVRVLAGETALFELIMRRHNQRLYRTIGPFFAMKLKPRTSCRRLLSAPMNTSPNLRAGRPSPRG